VSGPSSGAARSLFSPPDRLPLTTRIPAARPGSNPSVRSGPQMPSSPPPFPKFDLTGLLLNTNEVLVDPDLAERLLTLVEDRPDLVAAQVRVWLRDDDE
jgi:hypothetical protein